MKRAFQVGDRVALYQASGRLVGKVVGFLHGDPEIVNVIPDGYTGPLAANPKQLRRLKRSARRRVWIRESPGGSLTSGYYTQVMGGDGGHPDGRWIEFIEARPRKERK